MHYRPELIINETEIGRYLAGEANPEEAVLLEEWIAASPANKELFNQYLELSNSLNKEEAYPIPDKAEAWAHLKNKLPDLNKRTTSTPVRSLVKKYSIAASIAGIIFISAVAVYFYFKPDGNGTNNEITFAATNNIERKILPDNSEIVLNSNSSLSFPEKFKRGSRQTYLQGEAYFTITPNTSQPFIIAIDKIKIQVIGTSFNVKNIADKGTIETQVTTGKVKMYNSSGQIFITAGQTGIYNKNSNSFFIEDSLHINQFGYATRNFNFADEKLTSIISYLEKAYSKKIVLDNPQLGHCKMTSSFENKNIEYVLEVIAATLNLTYNVMNGVIHIGGNHEGC